MKELLEQADVLDDRVDLIAVECERLLQLVEDADEIEDEAVRLHHLGRLVLVRPIHPRDGLQQRVVAHRLVQIHGVKDGRVEAGEQLLGNDENLRPLAGLGEILANLPLSLGIEMPLFQVRRIVVVPGENDLGILRRQNRIERLLVERARLAVHRHEECLVAERLDVLAEMIRYHASHLLHSLLAFEEILQVDRAFEDLVQLLDVRDALRFGQREELLLHDLVRHQASR